MKTATDPAASAALPQVRRIPFEFADDLAPMWKPAEPEWCALINGISLTMPYLEPFLIRTVREARGHIADAQVRAEADAFMSQEGQHFRAHRRFNDILKHRHYPRLADVEAAMTASYAKLEQRSLRTRIAYTVGFESMTLGLTRWLVARRVRLFGGVDTRIASLVLWHLVEEIEHKCVAIDVYRACFPHGVMAYIARVFGIFHAALHVAGFSLRGAIEMLRTEGRWAQWRSRARLAYWLACLIGAVGPAMLRAALPRHDPRHEADPLWVRQWLAGYGQGDGGVPLVDTSHPQMPVPFSTAG